jgi:putative transposase
MSPAVVGCGVPWDRTTGVIGPQGTVHPEVSDVCVSSGVPDTKGHCCDQDHDESAERAERRARQKELADRLKASGALDGIFDQIDAGQVPLAGDDGLLKGMLKAALERGLEAELGDHVGYERGDPEASLFPNSRNDTSPKTVSSEIGDVELAVPRDRNGTFIPRLVPKGSRRLGGLDEMIISLYAGGMTVRDIQHHLVSTLGTELSHENDL